MPGQTQTASSARVTAGLLWIAAPVWYLLCEALTASQFPGYNYADFYISDLGVAQQATLDGRSLQSSIPQVMNAGFIGAGLLFLIGMLVLAPTLARGASTVAVTVLAFVYAAGITLVGLVQGSPDNADNGLMTWHVLGAVMAIGGGNLLALTSVKALDDLGRVRWLGPALGATGLACAALLSVGWLLADGVWERGAVYTFIAWQIIIGGALLRGSLTRGSHEQLA